MPSRLLVAALMFAACTNSTDPTADGSTSGGGTTAASGSSSGATSTSGGTTGGRQACLDGCVANGNDAGAHCDADCKFLYTPGTHDYALCASRCTTDTGSATNQCEGGCP